VRLNFATVLDDEVGTAASGRVSLAWVRAELPVALLEAR